MKGGIKQSWLRVQERWKFCRKTEIGKFTIMKIFLIISVTLLVCCLSLSEGKKSNKRRPDDGDDESKELESATDMPIFQSDSDRRKPFEDEESSAQALNPAAVNPYTSQLLLQNQGLYNNPALLGGTTPNKNSQTASAVVGSGQGVYNGNSFINQAVGGLNPYQNPLLFGGATIPGIGSPDIFSQSAAAAQLYNNPYLGAGALGGAGYSQGINPLLLRGATNLQYPIVAGGGNPYLAAQALLSPYANYNQLNPYNNFPFASRFGIGVGRSSIGNRQNSNNNNDE